MAVGQSIWGWGLMWWVYYRVMLSKQISVHNSIPDFDLYNYCQITIVEFVCGELWWIEMF